MELLILPVAIVMVMVFVALDSWRKDSVIQSAPEQALIDELKRRALLRKLEAQAKTEVDNLVRNATGEGNIPY